MIRCIFLGHINHKPNTQLQLTLPGSWWQQCFVWIQHPKDFVRFLGRECKVGARLYGSPRSVLPA